MWSAGYRIKVKVIRMTGLTLDTFIANDLAKNVIRVAIGAAKMEKRSFPHTLITGLPGSGKTTLDEIIAQEMGTNSILIMGRSVKDPDDISNAFVGLKDGDIVIIDEVHNIKKSFQEMLYSPMDPDNPFIPKNFEGLS